MSIKTNFLQIFVFKTLVLLLVLLGQNNSYAQKIEIQDSLISMRLKLISNVLELKYDNLVLDKIKTEIHSKETAELLASFFEIKEFLEFEISQRNLPAELLALPIAISKLNPLFSNELNQNGIWGLNPPLSIYYGLNIDKSIDERYDFYKSTVSALDYFQNLYEQNQDYWLSILIFTNSKAAINNLQNRNISTDDYWAIYKNRLLPNSEFILDFIFANYLINYYEEHNIKAIPKTIAETTEIEISEKIQISKLLADLNLQKEVFRSLNPVFISDFIYPNSDYNLILPKSINDKILNPEDTVLLSMIFQQKEITEQKTETSKTIERVYYTVKSGDNLGKIASKNNLSVDELKNLNNLKSDIIRPGQRLIVSKDYSRPISPVSQNPASINPVKADYIYYTVKSGDTLWSIAQKFPGVSDSEIKRLNNIGNTIHPGQKLKIKKK